MSVNPNLSALMRVIEENQSNMREGEYLEAMNALAALYREIPAPIAAPIAVAAAAAVPPHRTIPAGPSTTLFSTRILELMGGSVIEQRAWERVRNFHPDPFQNRILAEEWMRLPYETRFELLREATDYIVSKKEIMYRTPEPTVCPFITRHAFGIWSMNDDGNTNWECVCGYTGKVKNWKKHEQSERHQDWAKHRTVSRRKIEKMKEMMKDDEEPKNIVRYACYAPNPTGLYPGGLRFYTVWQDKNEWTHPEMFAECHRRPIPTEDGVGTWFVHPRNVRAIEYYQSFE